MRFPRIALIAALTLTPPLAKAADVIHACVHKSNGKVRIVSGSGMCKTPEKEIELAPALAPSGDFRLVGFTTGTIAGNVGALDWNRACVAEFAGARACTSQEVLLTTNPPTIVSPSDFAWVGPSFQGPSQGPMDASGQPLTPPLCHVFGASGLVGLLVDGHGRFASGNCSELHRLACCAPRD
jgi:hypothetical protein